MTLNKHLSAYWYMPTNRWPLTKICHNVSHSSLSSSLLKLPLLKITIGTAFYLLIRLEQWASDVSVLHAFCVQTRVKITDFCRGSKHLSSLGFSEVKIENFQENLESVVSWELLLNQNSPKRKKKVIFLMASFLFPSWVFCLTLNGIRILSFLDWCLQRRLSAVVFCITISEVETFTYVTF